MFLISTFYRNYVFKVDNFSRTFILSSFFEGEYEIISEDNPSSMSNIKYSLQVFRNRDCFSRKPYLCKFCIYLTKADFSIDDQMILQNNNLNIVIYRWIIYTTNRMNIIFRTQLLYIGLRNRRCTCHLYEYIPKRILSTDYQCFLKHSQ